MKPRLIDKQIWAVGAVDFDRRMFDASSPPRRHELQFLSSARVEKTALVDTVDPASRRC